MFHSFYNSYPNLIPIVLSHNTEYRYHAILYHRRAITDEELKATLHTRVRHLCFHRGLNDH